MASDALFTVQDGSAVFSHADRLVASVSAGDGASAAAYAAVPVEFGEDHCVALQNLRRVTDIIQGKAPDLADIVQSLFRQI